jgi:hypothetical protein
VLVLDPCLGQGILCPGTSFWVARTLLGGIRTHPRDPTRYLGVLDRIRGLGLCVQGSGASSWRSGPTDCILGYIILSGHVVPLELSTWWGSGVVHRAARDRRAGKWGQSLIGDWLAAPARPLMQLLLVRPWSRRLPRLSPRLTEP